MQCPSSMTQPTSSQCGSPRTDPLYPVDSTVRSRTITAPTCFLGQVDRVAAWCAIPMKYSFHPARMEANCNGGERGWKAERLKGWKAERAEVPQAVRRIPFN